MNLRRQKKNAATAIRLRIRADFELVYGLGRNTHVSKCVKTHSLTASVSAFSHTLISNLL